MPAFNAVLYDADGTLIDSFRAIEASVNYVRQQHGLAALAPEVVKSKVGNGLTVLMQETIPAGTVEENCRIYSEHHPSVIGPLTDLLPGVEQTVKALHRRGLRQGVCSNKPLAFTAAIVRQLGLDLELEVMLGPESVPRRKPAPDMLLEGARQLGATIDQTLYVGDMTIDIETARAAGMTVVVLPTGADPLEKLRAAQPDRILTRFDELLIWLR